MNLIIKIIIRRTGLIIILINLLHYNTIEAFVEEIESHE